jgi:carboxyl-terminal processing protease
MKNYCFFLVLVSLLTYNSNLLLAQKNDAAEIAKAVQKLANTLKIVDAKYIKDVNVEEATENAIKGLLEELDPHSVYISSKDYKKMNESLTGNFEGIGIRFDIVKDTILVVSTISGGPSEKVGLMAGDKIVSVDGETVAGKGITDVDVVRLLKGPKNTKVQVGIKRKSVKKLLDFTITRDKIPIFSVDAAYMATPTIGYIKINKFAANTLQEFSRGLNELKAQGMESLILDLRGNGGGYLRTAYQLADQFLRKGQLLVYTEGRSYPKKEYFARSRGGFEQGKLVVLINEGSASASEIVSGAVQDWDRGLIVGRRSFGKGLVQKPFELTDSSFIRLTIAHYYTPTGRSIQRPYDEGRDEYYKDVSKRYDRGEMVDMSKIDMPDSLKFLTKVNKRTVYGGGGIMPDYFVPVDTSSNSEYFSQLIRKGVLNQFLIAHAHENNEKITKKHPTNQSFINTFKVENSLMEDLFTYAAKEGIERNDEHIATSRKAMETRVKALLGRYIYDIETYFQIINPESDAYKKALEILSDKTFDKMNIRYKGK